MLDGIKKAMTPANATKTIMKLGLTYGQLFGIILVMLSVSMVINLTTAAKCQNFAVG